MIKRHEYPILEFDDEKEALINPFYMEEMMFLKMYGMEETGPKEVRFAMDSLNYVGN